MNDLSVLLAHWDKIVTLAAGGGFLLSWWRVTRKDRADLAAFAQTAARDMLAEHRTELDRLRGRLEEVEEELADLRREHIKMLSEKDAKIAFLEGENRQKDAIIGQYERLLTKHDIPHEPPPGSVLILTGQRADPAPGFVAGR
jgi:hypothetical protein